MITKDLAEVIDSLNYQDLPKNVVQQAKLCFLDFLAVSLRGSRTKSAQIVKRIISADISGDGKSTIIGGTRADPMDAALVNGVSAHSLDLDDGHRLAQIHPGACIIPAALSLSEAYGKSGKDFITSIVVGYQVATRLGMIINPEHREKGFHSTGTCGTIGAAATASEIMDLNKECILNALGLAGTQAAGLLESDHSGSMAKHLHAGRAAQSGVLSALLAKEGFTGAHTIIEGKEGILKAIGNEHTFQGNDTMTHTSEKFEILRVYFKKYPVCRHLHSSLDAAIGIMENNNLKSTDVQDITVETYEIAALHNNYHPDTPEGIRQSLPVSIAIAIKEGNLTVENISNVPLDSEITETTNKVKIKSDNDLNNLYPQKRPSKITIKCRDNVYMKRIDLAKGEPETPFNKDELLNKFRNLNPHFDMDCLKILDNLEDENFTELMCNLNQDFKMDKLN
jgi:2-methylcitrate dehydratase PrpD